VYETWRVQLVKHGARHNVGDRGTPRAKDVETTWIALK
jgi:hypothetical protein